MGLCSDESTKFLRNLGYNVVRLPRANIAPLTLVGVHKGESIEQGPLARLVTSTRTLPTIAPDEVMANISGRRTSKLSLGLGITMLNGLLGALGAAGANVKAHYKKAKTITFEYADVLSDSVLPFDVGDYLREGDIDAGNKVIEQYVLGNGRLFLITRTIKSRKFLVTASTSSEQDLEVGVEAIKRELEGKVEVSAAAETATTVTYEGKTPLVFGFQCLAIGVRDGILTTSAVAAGDQSMAIGDEERVHLLTPEGMLELR